MFIFLLGRPGCGKSEIFRRIKDKLEMEGVVKEVIRVDDFYKLWEIFQEDERTGQWKRCRKTEDGGYKVTDDTVWDEILKKVDDDLKKINLEGKIVFIEFSRPNYLHALKNFSKEVIDNSIVIYVYSSFETCWKRNVERHLRALAAGTDDHLVSREEMEKTYMYDDADELIKSVMYRTFYIDNENQGDEKLNGVTDEAVEIIKKFIAKTP